MIDIIVTMLLVFGMLFFLGTAVGILRLPDFYTRMHAASKGDTLSSMFLLGGMILYLLVDPSTVNVLTAVKLLFIFGFISIASPTAAHALTEAAFLSGARPWTKTESAQEDGVGVATEREDNS